MTRYRLADCSRGSAGRQAVQDINAAEPPDGPRHIFRTFELDDGGRQTRGAHRRRQQRSNGILCVLLTKRFSAGQDRRSRPTDYFNGGPERLRIFRRANCIRLNKSLLQLVQHGLTVADPSRQPHPLHRQASASFG